MSKSKFYQWRRRYGMANEHNGHVCRDHWLLPEEKQAIISYARSHPLEGYRRLTYMMIDADVAATSPATVYRIMKTEGLLGRWAPKNALPLPISEDDLNTPPQTRPQPSRLSASPPSNLIATFPPNRHLSKSLINISLTLRTTMKITQLFTPALIAVGGLLLMNPHTAAARSPIHAQLDELAEMANGKRLGILTNGSARNSAGQHDVDYLLSHEGTTVSAFFGPEHGFRGDLQDGAKIVDGIDPETSVPVYSLYGKRKAPTNEQLASVDMFVFDIPDVGARFYTYTWTMTHCLDACARLGIPFVVVDRPNPITGTHVAGAVNEKDLGLIGRLGNDAEFGVATRHGMTIGEIATMWNEEWTTKPKAKLHVIKAPNWKRDQWLDETDREFIAPSPNMRTLSCATVYPGTCIFEGTNLNEGRGTPKPFEMMGAPFIDGDKWAAALNAKNLPGVKFEGIKFTPDSRRHKGEECGGVRVIVTDRDALEAVRTGIHMLQTIVKLYPEQVKITDYAGRLMATPDLETRIKTEDADDIVKSWEPGLAKFLALRSKYLLYPESE